MFWVVQKDVHASNARFGLPEALSRLGISFALAEVAGGAIQSPLEIPDGQPVITNGSVMLSRVALERGWEPGSFLNDNFSYKAWSKPYREWLLNRGAAVSALKDARPIGDRFFARPVLDDKTFNGRVFEREEFERFQRASIEGDRWAPRPETQIVMAPAKRIGQEHRHYIVDGEIITSSRYKFAGQPNFREGADDAVLELVARAVERWAPARAFVMDTYIAGDEIGIVELGCVCHAGVYEADLMKLAAALDAMPFDPSPAPARKPSNSP